MINIKGITAVEAKTGGNSQDGISMPIHWTKVHKDRIREQKKLYNNKIKTNFKENDHETKIVEIHKEKLKYEIEI